MKQTKVLPPKLPPDTPALCGVLGEDELGLKIELSAVSQCLKILYDREWKLTQKGDNPEKLDILWDTIGRVTQYKNDIEHALAKFDTKVAAPRLSRLDRLKEDLQTAISIEDYEMCALLRDEINQIQ